MVRAVPFANLGNASAHIRRFPGWRRRHIRPPQRVTQCRLLVRPVDHDIAVTRLDTGARMVRNKSAQPLRHAFTPQELGAIHRMESSPTDRWRVADVVQPRRSQQEVAVINHVDCLPSLPSNALDVPPPPRHSDEVVPRQLRSPRNEVIGHTANRSASLNDLLLPGDCLGQPYSLSPRRARRWAAFARSSATDLPYRSSICLERHPASIIRSCSWPPLASQLWANQWRSMCG